MKGMTPAALRALLDGDLENFAAASTPGGIEAQEARGQQDMVNRDILPKEMFGDKTKEKLEKMGIVFHDDYDDLFVNVTLPKGWKKVATDHSMHSDLIDEKGRKRAGIFYKAAFYDRNAHISLARRFSAEYAPEDMYKSDISYEARQKGEWFGIAKDCGDIIFRTEPVTNPIHELRVELQGEAVKWLDKKFPKWRDETAYWD